MRKKSVIEGYNRFNEFGQETFDKLMNKRKPFYVHRHSNSMIFLFATAKPICTTVAKIAFIIKPKVEKFKSSL